MVWRDLGLSPGLPDQWRTHYPLSQLLIDSVHRGNMEKILFAYCLPDENVTAIIMLYKITGTMIPSPDGNTDGFVRDVGVLQLNALTPYLFKLCEDYVLSMLINLIKANSFTIKTNKKQMISQCDYNRSRLRRRPSASAKYISLSSISTTQPKAGSICVDVNANKTNYIRFKQKRTISTLNGKPLKLVNLFIYLGCNILSTESDDKVCLVKA